MFVHTPFLGGAQPLLDRRILPVAKLEKITNGLFDESGLRLIHNLSNR